MLDTRTMRRLSLLLALCGPGCGPGDGTSTTGGTGSTAEVTGTGTGSTAATTGAPTTGTGTTGVLPDGQCRTQADCEDFEQCEPAGAVQCGGATGCTLDGSECSDDAACGGTPESPQICVPDPCCGLSLCQPGCRVDGDCGLAQRCGPDARCAPASCDPQTPCPADFSCVEARCEPSACSGDGECDGYCVYGRCSAAPGNCVAPAP